MPPTLVSCGPRHQACMSAYSGPLDATLHSGRKYVSRRRVTAPTGSR